MGPHQSFLCAAVMCGEVILRNHPSPASRSACAEEISAANRPTGKNEPACTLRKEDADRVFVVSVRKIPPQCKKGISRFG